MNCYVYFKAKIEHEAAIIIEERKLNEILRQRFSYMPRLERRPDTTNDLHTWMEVYEDISDTFEQDLKLALMQTDLPNLQYSERHVEFFLNVDVCA
ncbi:DUF4936 family protein [Undibacterium sp. Ji67W]|uniref:DUF4936 family protein n=1 Tax=Undibacterium sp. Ji67W TaxID=3413042 RepID=UPI003BF327BE